MTMTLYTHLSHSGKTSTISCTLHICYYHKEAFSSNKYHEWIECINVFHIANNECHK